MTDWVIERGEEDFDAVLMTTLSLARKENSDLWKDGYFERLRTNARQILFRHYTVEIHLTKNARFIHFRKVKTV